MGSVQDCFLSSLRAAYEPLASWTFYYVHRPPTAKFIEYEKEIRKIASFGSVSTISGAKRCIKGLCPTVWYRSSHSGPSMRIWCHHQCFHQ